MALFTGVISSVLVDLLDSVNANQLRLVYHSWNGISDTGIYIDGNNVDIVKHCLLRAGYVENPVELNA